MGGGGPRTPGAPVTPPIDLVRAYLEALKARDIGKANGLLVDGFAMTFRGGVVLCSLEELAAWAKPRYRSVRKVYERFDEVIGEDGVTVYCFGTLSGESPDGAPFSGVRFIDRFTVAGGRPIDQIVWNDLAENRDHDPRD